MQAQAEQWVKVRCPQCGGIYLLSLRVPREDCPCGQVVRLQPREGVK